ncbi:hypothetical protein L484_011322 [Morus notabilis]|uniref:Protein GRIM REAPER n=1 Tax=Morus notabilis TaxID=981085 RepID=W9QXI4_9ROSA|nr:protein GRIM REAPER [Morus notabilis]EXB42551.1 hypothetical protein L484_011322 [Morus notabilis]
MANYFLINLTTILSLTLSLSLLPPPTHSHMSFSNDVIIDTAVPNFKSRSWFLAGVAKKGMRCDPYSKRNICNGVPANKGSGLLYCCKAHCRNVLGDGNNCGRCGQKCRLGEHCCNGICTNVLWNASNCGKCGKKCKGGVRCENGYCGYA